MVFAKTWILGSENIIMNGITLGSRNELLYEISWMRIQLLIILGLSKRAAHETWYRSNEYSDFEENHPNPMVMDTQAAAAKKGCVQARLKLIRKINGGNSIFFRFKGAAYLILSFNPFGLQCLWSFNRHGDLFFWLNFFNDFLKLQIRIYNCIWDP